MHDQIIIQITHGYFRKRKHKHVPKELGAWFGGHVMIQIENHYFGFIYQDIKKIHIFPARQKNSTYQKMSIKEWNEFATNKKRTAITIPCSAEEKQILLDYYNKNLKSPSCDYSFFGERCASSCYHLLKKIDKIKGGHYFFNAFYPRQLRKKLIKEAQEKAYSISITPGPKDRIWEGG